MEERDSIAPESPRAEPACHSEAAGSSRLKDLAGRIAKKQRSQQFGGASSDDPSVAMRLLLQDDSRTSLFSSRRWFAIQRRWQTTRHLR
jgi:hypothetical protein